jgi:hypothetical protein
MVCKPLSLFLVFLAIFPFRGASQVFQSKQAKLFRATADTIVIDSLSLVPGTLNFRFFPASDSAKIPEINYRQHAIIFRKGRPDSILVSYRRFPYNFERVHFHKDEHELYTDLSRRINPYTINYSNSSTTNLFESDGLNKNGNISRGITFGNNQDVVVNSNLNLQVSGKLTPEIDLLMAATDNNIPFQADGTTAQLQEFDKVFIQLNNESTKMIVGDYQLSRPQNSYFMNFYKRAQGIYVENAFKDSSLKNTTFRTQVSGAVSKGKFSRQIFFGTENNQGPYRLRGADNEPFIIVLSGTERIYIDGKLLQRGQENDYIIDYNTGELTFTARQLITKDKRIVAEFQYAERNYARSLFFFGEEASTKRSKIYLNYFSEQDNKNKPLQQTLTQPQKNVLIDIGDSLDQAYYSGAELKEFNTNEIFYRKLDSISDGFVYPDVYVHITQPDSANYTLKFSLVGAGKGNYIQENSSANGKVYKWIAPVNGMPQGNFEPVIPLVTPKQNQMLTGGFTYSFSAFHSLGIEGAYTKYDINKFSTKDKRNDEGSGVKVLSRNEDILSKDTSGVETRLVYNLGYEFVQQRFHQVERFRTIEFDRDWNRPLSSILLNDQHLSNAEVGVKKGKAASLVYGIGTFDEGNTYSGKRNTLLGNYKNRTFSAMYNGSYLLSSDAVNAQNTQFYRHKSLFSQRVDRMKLQYSDDFENNLFHRSGSGLLLPRSYQFWEWEASISNADSSKNNIKIFYRERRDKLNRSTELSDSTKASNIGIQASIYSIKNNPITVLMTYRKLNLINVVGNALKPDNTLLNRFEYNPRYWKGFVVGSLFYETGYGLENKKDYYYLEVAPGQGQYAWNDYNGNGLKERDEFEIALYGDQQRFIRIYTPTNEYVKVLQNQLSISATVRPSSILNGAKGKLRAFINRWSFQTAMRHDNKVNDNNSLDNYNPFAIPTGSLLLASNNNVRHSIFFNQSSAVFGADYTYIDNQGKQILTNGLEEKLLHSDQVRWRFNFLQSWSVFSDNTLSRKSNNSEFFPIRNYIIDGKQTEERLAFQPNTTFRISGIYKYDEKKNIIGESRESATLNSLGMELRYNQTEKGSFTGRVDVIRIVYSGQENTAVSYEMLNGLSRGDNFTWEVAYQRNLNSNIQISINYNGRKTPTAPVVHLGGAQIRAFF